MFWKKAKNTKEDSLEVSNNILDPLAISSKEEEKAEDSANEDILNISSDFTMEGQKVDDNSKDTIAVTDDILESPDNSWEKKDKIGDILESAGSFWKEEEKKIDDILESIDSSWEEKDDLWFIDLEGSKPKKKGFFDKMFWKKEEKVIDELEEIKTHSSNIFEDFDLDSELWKEVKDIQTSLHKDSFYYLLKLVNVFKYINIFMVIILWAAFYYTVIQNDNQIQNESILDPVCDFILWEGISSDLTFCSSISYINEKSKEDETSLKKELYRQIVSILPEIYKNENFLNSKEILFLLENGEERLRPLEILSEFDKLKNKFESIDKARISCKNMKIDVKWVLTTTCTVFSSDWETGYNTDKEKGIIWFDWNPDWKKVSWTSISVAASFLNFLENRSSKLILLKKPKSFSFTDNIWENTWYTKKTTFDVVMQYKTNNLFY